MQLHRIRRLILCEFFKMFLGEIRVFPLRIHYRIEKVSTERRGCNIECCIHVSMYDIPAVRALEPFPVPPSKSPAPDAPLGGVGRIHIYDRDAEPRRLLFHHFLEEKE